MYLRLLSFFSLLAVLVITITGCGAANTPAWHAATLEALNGEDGNLLVAQLDPSDTPTPIPPTATPTNPPTLTPVPPTATPTNPPPSPTPEPTHEPEAVANAGSLGDGDVANGEALFNTFQADAGFMCATCHHVDSEDRLIGPGLLNIPVRAETRVEGQSAVDYLHESIVEPSAFVVPDYPDNLMPQNWADIYSEDEINDIVAYLLTLQG